MSNKFSVRRDGADLILSTGDLSLADTLDCGQAFRWEKRGDKWHGVAFGRALTLFERDGDFVFENTTDADFESVWRRYFDLDRDYAEIKAALAHNAVLNDAARFAGGIRLLRQEPWETVCSFIISQNNNIPRIKGIISRLCEGLGDGLGGGDFSFPGPERLASLEVRDLDFLRSGFRAKYILDAARKISSGELDLDAVAKMSVEEARAALMTVRGIGPKVADCALLFGFGMIDCFPVDVWIRRAMQVLFGGELPECARPYAGIVQQYIFHYARMTKLNIEQR